MLNQLQPILNQATKHKKGRKAKSRPIFISKRTQVLYLTALNALVDELHQATIEELNKIVQVGDSKRVNDSFFDNFNKWFGHFGKFIKDKIASMAQKMAEKIVNEQKKASDKQFIEILYKQTGLDLTGLMKDEDLEQAVAEAIAINVSLIKSIPEQYLARVEQAVLNGLQSGQLNKTLAEELQKIHAITRNRAQLIATDQMAKINSRLGQIRQQKMGVTHYTWSTSRDERVRHSHRLRDGQIFAWDNPPDDGHAGMAIRCRCVAIPYTEHLFNKNAPTPEELMGKQNEEHDFSLFSPEIEKIIFTSQAKDDGEIFNPRKFKRIVEALQKQGVPLLLGDEGKRFANQMGGEAIYYPTEIGLSGFFAFPENPTRTQVIEELLHYGQHRKTGFASLEWEDIVKFEIEAQHKLLLLGRKLNWSESEIEQIKRALSMWEKYLLELS